MTNLFKIIVRDILDQINVSCSQPGIYTLAYTPIMIHGTYQQAW